MEASEQPQLNLGAGPAGTVRVLDDRIVVEALTVADERAARLVRERAEAGRAPIETIAKAIEIGARVLDSEGAAANVDYVRRELESGLGDLDRKLSERLEAGAGDLSERIAATFGAERNDSVQAQIKEIVTAEARQQRDALFAVLTAEDGANPLVAMQARIGKAVIEAEERHRQEMVRLRDGHTKEARALQTQMGGLREELARLTEREDADRRVAVEVERGTAKGRGFEDLVHAIIDEVAAGAGDVAHHTGDASTESGGKKGDVVVEVGGQHGGALATIVFEAKNKRLSRNDAWTELNGCMAERDADFAVLIVAGEDKIPAGLEDLTEYQGNKIIAVLDRDDPDPLALRLVYRYVRARILASGHDSLEVDAAGVRDAVEEAGARLKRANRVRKSLTSITNSADSARTEFDEIVADVERCLARVDSLIAAAASAE